MLVAERWNSPLAPNRLTKGTFCLRWRTTIFSKFVSGNLVAVDLTNSMLLQDQVPLQVCTPHRPSKLRPFKKFDGHIYWYLKGPQHFHAIPPPLGYLYIHWLVPIICTASKYKIVCVHIDPANQVFQSLQLRPKMLDFWPQRDITVAVLIQPGLFLTLVGLFKGTMNTVILPVPLSLVSSVCLPPGKNGLVAAINSTSGCMWKCE